MKKKKPLSYFFGKMSKEDAWQKKTKKNVNTIFQCITCAFRLEAEQAPEECPKYGSQLSFSRIVDWRFF